MTHADPATVPGLVESRLSAEDLDALPLSVPAAPWLCRARALVWLQRATPPSFAWEGRAWPLSLVALVEYLDSPVGPYHEVLAGSLVRVGRAVLAQVPFIAVDSPASVRGGRANWALPKTTATFDGSLREARMAVTGDGWTVDVGPVSAAPAPPTVPLLGAFSCVGPLGRYRTTLRGRGRPVSVEAAISGPTLGPWLGNGHHRALLTEGRVKVFAPRP